MKRLASPCEHTHKTKPLVLLCQDFLSWSFRTSNRPAAPITTVNRLTFFIVLCLDIDEAIVNDKNMGASMLRNLILS